MKSPSAPPTPNFGALAKQQADLTNKAQKFNQYNPFGSQTWEQTQDGRWISRTNLSDDQQYLFNQGTASQKALASRAPGYAQMVADYLGQPIGSGEDVRNRVEGELLGRLNTQSDRDLEQTRSRLLNQGITENSEAWRRAMSDFDMNRQNARTAAILNAGQEASRQVAMDTGLRNQYMSELANILGQTGATIPNYGPLSGAAAPDIYGAAQDSYAAALQGYNAKLGQQAQLYDLLANGVMAAGKAVGGMA